MSLEQLPAGPLPTGANHLGEVSVLDLPTMVLDDVTTLSGTGDYVFYDNWGRGTLGLELAGTWVATIDFEVRAGRAGTWVPITAINLATGALVQSTTVPGTFVLAQNGLTDVRANVSAYTSGTIEFHTGQGYDPTLVRLSASLPAGTNAIGKLAANSGVDIGTVTANAGTNLNTSALALEATQTAQATLIGAVTESAPATDTASSGLNGRLQRIAQRITSLIALVPAALGQGTMAQSFRVVVASDQSALPVASHAVTNAGTFATQVDGAALTALQLIDDPVIADDAAFTPATSKVMMAGFEVDDTGTDSVDEGDAGAARMSANRNQYVQLRDAAGNERGANVNASNQLAVAGPVTNAGTFAVQDSEKLADNAGFTDGTTKVLPVGYIFDEVAGTALTENDIAAARVNANRATVGAIEDGATRARYATVTAANALKTDGSAVTQPVSNAGTFATQESGGALTSLQLLDDTILADDAAFTPGTTKVSMIGLQADETSTDSIDEGDAGAPRMTLDRRQIVVPQPHAAGGLSIFRSIDLDEGTLEVVKNSAGCVYGMWVTNTATTTRWIKFYDAASGTLGTGTPVITIGIPGNTSDDIAGNFGPGGVGIQFATGICVGASTGLADADTGAPGANDVICNIFYK